MVNGVNNNYTNAYIKSSSTKVRAEQDVPKFLLGDDDGVVWDRKPGSKEDKKSNEADKAGTPQVKSQTQKIDTYEPSTASVAKTRQEQLTDDKDTVGFFNGIIDSVKNLFSRIFNFIWYGNDEKIDDNAKTDDENTATNVSPETKAVTKEAPEKKYRLAADIEYEEKLQAAKEGVKGIPARSTSLLTTYDRHGLIRNVTPSDEGRILKGDRSIKM